MDVGTLWSDDLHSVLFSHSVIWGQDFCDVLSPCQKYRKLIRVWGWCRAAWSLTSLPDWLVSWYGHGIDIVNIRYRNGIFGCFILFQVVNPSFPNPRRRLRLRDLAERVIDAQENEQELNKLLNEALLERETVQAWVNFLTVWTFSSWCCFRHAYL